MGILPSPRYHAPPPSRPYRGGRRRTRRHVLANPAAAAIANQAYKLEEWRKAQDTALAKQAHRLKQMSMGKRKVYTNDAATAIARQAYKKMGRDRRHQEAIARQAYKKMVRDNRHQEAIARQAYKKMDREKRRQETIARQASKKMVREKRHHAKRLRCKRQYKYNGRFTNFKHIRNY